MSSYILDGMDISLVNHERHYLWSRVDWQLSAWTGLSGLPFAVRHLGLASKTNLMIQSLMHRVVACVEFIPVIGLIAATFEKLIAKRFLTPLDPFDKLVPTLEKAFHFHNDRSSYVDNGAIDRVLFGSYDTGELFEPTLCHLPNFAAYSEELKQRRIEITMNTTILTESVAKKAQMIVIFLFGYLVREGRYDRAEKIRDTFGSIPHVVLQETYAHIASDFHNKNRDPIEGVSFLLREGLQLDFDYPEWGLAALIKTLCDPARPCVRDWTPLIQLLGSQVFMVESLFRQGSETICSQELVFMRDLVHWPVSDPRVSKEAFVANQQPCAIRKLGLIMGILKHHNVSRDRYPHWILAAAAGNDWLDLATACVGYGFDVNFRSKRYPIALYNSASAGMMSILVLAGADVKQQEGGRGLALQSVNTVAKAKVLLDAGADLASIGDYFFGKCLLAAHLMSIRTQWSDLVRWSDFNEMLGIFRLVVSRGAKVTMLNYKVDEAREKVVFLAAHPEIAESDKEKAFQAWLSSELFHRSKIDKALRRIWRFQTRLLGWQSPFPEALSCKKTTPAAIRQIMEHFREGIFARRSHAVILWGTWRILGRVRAQKRGDKVISKPVSIASAAWASRRLEALPKALKPSAPSL